MLAPGEQDEEEGRRAVGLRKREKKMGNKKMN